MLKPHGGTRLGGIRRRFPDTAWIGRYRFTWAHDNNPEVAEPLADLAVADGSVYEHVPE